MLGRSSLRIVPIAVDVPIVAPVDEWRTTLKLSSFSTIISPLTSIEIIFELSPVAKDTVPDGSTPLGKSAAFAGTLPTPTTRHRTLLTPLRSPVRLTVKVKALLPLLPSSWAALLAAIERVVAMIKEPCAENYLLLFNRHPPSIAHLVTYLQISWRDWLSVHFILMHVMHMIVSAAECRAVQSKEPVLASAGPDSPAVKV
jgi:hypothetical protein